MQQRNRQQDHREHDDMPGLDARLDGKEQRHARQQLEKQRPGRNVDRKQHAGDRRAAEKREQAAVRVWHEQRAGDHRPHVVVDGEIEHASFDDIVEQHQDAEQHPKQIARVEAQHPPAHVFAKRHARGNLALVRMSKDDAAQAKEEIDGVIGLSKYRIAGVEQIMKQHHRNRGNTAHRIERDKAPRMIGRCPLITVSDFDRVEICCQVHVIIPDDYQ
jgi:hypothetical protein